jgi:hypothetical protein
LVHLSYLPILWMNRNLILNVIPFSSMTHHILCVLGVSGFCNFYCSVLWHL